VFFNVYEHGCGRTCVCWLLDELITYYVSLHFMFNFIVLQYVLIKLKTCESLLNSKSIAIHVTQAVVMWTNRLQKLHH